MPIILLIGLGLIGLVVYESQKKPAQGQPPQGNPPVAGPPPNLPPGYQYPCYPGYTNFPAGCTPNYQAPAGSPCLPGYPGWPPGCQPAPGGNPGGPPGSFPSPGFPGTPGFGVQQPSFQPPRVTPAFPGRGHPGGAPAIVPLPETIPGLDALLGGLVDLGQKLITAYNGFNDANSGATGPVFAPGSDEYKSSLNGVLGNILDTPIPGLQSNLWAGPNTPIVDPNTGQATPRYTTDPGKRAQNIEDIRRTLFYYVNTGNIANSNGNVSSIICGLPALSKALDPDNAANYPDCVINGISPQFVAGNAKARTEAMMRARTMGRKSKKSR